MSDMNVVVLCFGNQLKHLSELLGSLCVQLAASDKCLVVYQGTDTEHACAVCSTHDVDCVASNPPFVGFSAGYNRDTGVQYLIKKHGVGTEGDFLFIDGDCIPSPELIKHHKYVLSHHDNVIGCGLRVNKMEDGTLHVDRRLGHPATRMRLFVRGVDRLLLNPKEILSHSAAWSCNLSVSHKAARNIIASNKITAHSTSDRLFNSCFDGMWGGEDTLVGMLGFRTNAKLVFLDPDRSHVTHIEHPVGMQGSENLRRCFELDKTTRHRLPGSCRLVVKSNGKTDPLPDTTEFYANIIGIEQSDPFICKLAELMNITEMNELFTLHYLFSANPFVGYVDYGVCKPVLQPARVLELYNKVRTEVFTLKDFNLHPMQHKSGA